MHLLAQVPSPIMSSIVHMRLSLSSPPSLSTSICPSASSSSSNLSFTSSCPTELDNPDRHAKHCAIPQTRGVTTPTTSTPSLTSCDGQAADAVSAKTQVKMEDAHRLLKIPKSECRDTWIRLPRHKWPKSWSSMEDPIVPLEQNLYGHPLARTIMGKAI